VVERRAEQRFPLAEMVLERAVRDARSLADRDRRRAGVSVLDQAFDGRVEKLGAGFGGASRLSAAGRGGRRLGIGRESTMENI
jgi:hypothetical protein